MADDAADSLDVYASEWNTIRSRGRSAPPRGLSGLALSGGGIRSATFNLGVLQALNRGGVLRDFDYLSTVSGGGYIGGWWSAWLARPGANRRGTFPADEGSETDRYEAPRPDPIHHVRLFANYLIPRTGVMSRDMWRAVTVIARNLVLTWAALVPLLATAVVVAHAAFLWLYGSTAPGSGRLWGVASLPLAFGLWFGVLSALWLLVQHGGSRGQWLVTVASLAAIGELIWAQLPDSRGGFHESALLVATAAIAVVAARVFSPRRTSLHDDAEVFRNRLARLQGAALVLAVVTAIVGVAIAYGAQLVTFAFSGTLLGPIDAQRVTTYTAWVTLAATAISAVHTARTSAPAGGADAVPRPNQSLVSRLLVRAAPMLVILTLVLTLVWLSHWAAATLTGWTVMLGHAALIGAFAMAFYATSERADTSAPAALLALAVLAIIAGAGLAIFGRWPAVSLGLALLSGAAIGGWKLTQHLRGKSAQLDRSLLLLLAATVLLLAVPAMRLSAGIVPDPVRFLAGLAALLFTTVILIGWTTDPNRLSLHTFYKMRLVRAYVGASNPNRGGAHAEDITESKRGDDVLLSEISGADGPYHLINATLNLTSGTDLVIAQRAAAPFLFSRHFCGSARTGFRPTAQYRAGTMTLGTAVAISGAAASPVMGSQTPSTATSMLLALLNVRLGYWVPTPNQPDWEAPQARLWPFYLLREFLSHVADTGSHCYVTDGGHFDNTGVYPLVERGCQTIVLTDCGADPDTVFDDLANLVRRCRIDFGAEIAFPTLAPFSRATLAADRKPYVEGTITYRRAHLNALGWQLAENDPLPAATLLVVKPTLVAELETDVNRYSQQYADFPQQTTADQWFDEAQFESYRRLGEKSGIAALSRLPTPLRVSLPRPADVPLVEGGYS